MDICGVCGEFIEQGQPAVWDGEPMHEKCAGPEYDEDEIHEEDEPWP